VTSRLSAITINTFREAVRDRVLYNLIVFALLLVASAPLFGAISIDIERLVLVNVGLSSISLFGVIIAILIGIGLVSKEIEKRTLYTILSRPVRRWEFIVGKYFGLLLTLVVNAALMTLGFYLALLATQHKLTQSDAGLLVAIYFIVLEIVMMTAIALLFSSFSTPVFAAIFSFALFIIGTFGEDLRNVAASSHGVTRWFATAAAYVAPNFSSLNVISQVAHDKPIASSLVVFNTLYALLYSAAVTAGAMLIFNRRNLK
jgi:ABC-type transport system involved in multi-copper enzyme maturation permease subunit